jgi:hypothetical protein
MNHLLLKLNKEIDLSLKECDKVLTPKICEMRSNTEGYRKLKEMIAQRVRVNGVTIIEAIIQIEKEFGQTLMED